MTRTTIKAIILTTARMSDANQARNQIEVRGARSPQIRNRLRTRSLERTNHRIHHPLHMRTIHMMIQRDPSRSRRRRVWSSRSRSDRRLQGHHLPASRQYSQDKREDYMIAPASDLIDWAPIRTIGPQKPSLRSQTSENPIWTWCERLRASRTNPQRCPNHV
jgi:hypothetical protein